MNEFHVALMWVILTALLGAFLLGCSTQREVISAKKQVVPVQELEQIWVEEDLE